MTIAGIDVSSAQGTITPADWHALAARGIRFVYVKCGNGNNAPDPFFARYVADARAAGIVVGAYHVGFPLPRDPAHPGRDAATQARMHVEQSGALGAKAGELPPVLDFEWPLPKDWADWGVTAAHAGAWGLEYLAELAALIGRAPLLYTYPDFFQHVAGGFDVSAYATYPLWLARYEVSAPGTISPWGAPLFWQRSGGGGRLPNGEPVDEDEFLGSEAAFQWLLRGPSSSPLPPGVVAGGGAALFLGLVTAAIALALRRG